MAEAFKCDLTGKLCEGKVEHAFLAPINDTVSLLCYPQKKVNEHQNVGGALSPETVEKIKAAIAAIVKK